MEKHVSIVITHLVYAVTINSILVKGIHAVRSIRYEWKQYSSI